MDDQKQSQPTPNPQPNVPPADPLSEKKPDQPNPPAAPAPETPAQPETTEPTPVTPQTTVPTQPITPVEHQPAQPPVYQPTQPVAPPKPVVNAVVTTPGESAGEFQNRVIQSEQVKEVKQARRTYKLENAVNVLFGAIEASLAVRLAFKLLGARTTSAFVDFLYDFTGVFAGPFEGIFGANPSFGSFELDLGAIIGMIIYGAVGFGVVKLVKVF
jgi:hypothetical protein